MIKKIIISIILVWLLLVAAIEMSIISEDLVRGVVNTIKIKALKTISLYSL